MHFCWRLGSGCHLELDLDTIDGVYLAGSADIEGRHDHRDLPRRRVLPQAAPHLAARPAVEQDAVHIGGPAGHRGARIDVLLHRMSDEALRRQDCYLAGIDVGLVSHPEYATEVIHVAVGVDHGHNGPVPAVLPIQGQCRGGGLGRDQRVDDDDAGIALNEADVGQVQSTYLIDALDDLIQTLFGGKLRLAPQTGVYRRRRIVSEERVGVVVPDHPAVGGFDDAGFQRAEEPAVGVVEVGGVLERQ